jgi:hypothetical protein
VNSCFFTMVAVDDRRNPVAVAPLQPATPDELRRHAAAIARKQLRQEFAQRAPGRSQAAGRRLGALEVVDPSGLQRVLGADDEAGRRSRPGA